MTRPLKVACLGLVLLATGGATASRSPAPLVLANDNRTPAGTRTGDTLRLRLVVQLSTWRPESDTGPSVQVPAFAEEGGTPRIPGPLIRVPAGTIIDASVRNALTDSTITVFGLATRPAATYDSVRIEPGDSARVRFPVGQPGTYFYRAAVGVQDTVVEHEQLAGALIVDSAGNTPPDRVFVINIWGEPRDSVTYSNALAINGRSWPYTERITATVGDTLRWRVINATVRRHPMHLHGFFFRVDARGNFLADTVLPPDRRLLEVTEHMMPFGTASLSWSPDRPGNWLFHCHIGFHVLPEAARLETMAADAPEHHSANAGEHMAGLVLGIMVAPRAGWSGATKLEPNRLRLYVQEGARRGRAPRIMGFVLGRGNAAPARDSVLAPGPMLVLHRDQPTVITVINRLAEATAIHWHGLELESWSDGVAGWSGEGTRVAPTILPGDSFTAHLTLRRAGTFMYHTHLSDLEQLSSGMYGPIVVLEPGRRFDPRTDHLFIAGWDGAAEPPHMLVNGDSVAGALQLAPGRAHRFRFINIGLAGRVRFSIWQDSTMQAWRAIAKDGADLPAALAVDGPARTMVVEGSTADFTWRPAKSGLYRLEAAWGPRDPAVWTQRLEVR